MINRGAAVELIVDEIGGTLKLVSCLGFISRDVFFFVSKEKRSDCFFNVGAMGSTLPLALGIAIAKRNLSVWAIEGDGSILMNLGGLVTYLRYDPGNLVLFVFDNRQYETTGGQCSQPDGFHLLNVSLAVGLKTTIVDDVKSLTNLLQDLKSNKCKYHVVIVKTRPDKVSPRIVTSPQKISADFRDNLF